MSLTGLALSGGGLRATFFHLGVISYLRATGELKRLRFVSSVSGGSIIAAHMLIHWEDYISEDDAVFSERTKDLYLFAQRNIRNRVLLRLPLSILTRKSAADYLRRQYKWLYGKHTLSPEHAGSPLPQFLINCSNLRTGELLSFTQNGLQAVSTVDGNRVVRSINTRMVPASYAVAASSAFPALFPPLMLESGKIACDTQQLEEIGLKNGDPLSDGGIYDNLGLRALEGTPELSMVSRVIVSDTAMELDWDHNLRKVSHFRTPLRAVDVIMKRSHDQELQQSETELGDRFSALSISSEPPPHPTEMNAGELEHIQRDLKWLRTDLDKFHLDEIVALVRHGFRVAAAGLPPAGNLPEFERLPEWCKTKSSPATIYRRVKAGARRKIISIPLGDPMVLAYTAIFGLIFCLLFVGFVKVRSELYAKENVFTTEKSLSIRYSPQLVRYYLASSNILDNQRAPLNAIYQSLKQSNEVQISALLQSIPNGQSPPMEPSNASVVASLANAHSWPTNTGYETIHELLRYYSVEGKEAKGPLYLHTWIDSPANNAPANHKHVGVCFLQMPSDHSKIKLVLTIDSTSSNDVQVAAQQLSQNTSRPSTEWKVTGLKQTPNMDIKGEFWPDVPSFRLGDLEIRTSEPSFAVRLWRFITEI